MIASCLFTSLAEIENPRLRAHVSEHVHQSEIGLTSGQDYQVYGVIFRSGTAWFYLCDELESEYPTPYCSVFFRLKDSRVPDHWRLVPDSPALLLPEAWARIPDFLEKLVDGDSVAVAAFTREVEFRRT